MKSLQKLKEILRERERERERERAVIHGTINNNLIIIIKIVQPIGPTDPTRSTWVGLDFFNSPWWVGLEKLLNLTQLNPCTPLAKGISVLIKFLRVFLDMLYV